jgi:hypothetical protein
MDYIHEKLALVVPFGTENVILKIFLRTIHSPALPVYVDLRSQEKLYAKAKPFKQELQYQKNNQTKRTREETSDQEEEEEEPIVQPVKKRKNSAIKETLKKKTSK